MCDGVSDVTLNNKEYHEGHDLVKYESLNRCNSNVLLTMLIITYTKYFSILSVRAVSNELVKHPNQV